MTPSVPPNSSKPFHHTVVVIPLGPSELVEHILDTLDSILRFLSPDTKVILVDNSRKGTGNIVQQAFPDADVIHGTRQGMFAHLFLNICQGTAHAYEHYCFRVLLRMDTPRGGRELAEAGAELDAADFDTAEVRFCNCSGADIKTGRNNKK